MFSHSQDILHDLENSGQFPGSILTVTSGAWEMSFSFVPLTKKTYSHLLQYEPSFGMSMFNSSTGHLEQDSSHYNRNIKLEELSTFIKRYGVLLGSNTLN